MARKKIHFAKLIESKAQTVAEAVKRGAEFCDVTLDVIIYRKQL